MVRRVLGRRRRARRSASSFLRAEESLLSEDDELGALGFILNLIVVAPFSNGERNRQTIAPRRKRTSGERRIRAGWIFEMVEIEDELAGFVETIGGKAGVEKTAGGVSGCGAGSVTKNEEKFWLGRVFEDRFEARRIR